MNVNIKIVAERAGVSPATVSRVLNTPERVSEDTRTRILAVMSELDYHPSGVARSLSSKRTNTIGVLVPGISNQFFIELYKGILATATECGLDVFVYDTKRIPKDIANAFVSMKQRQIDGIIFTSALVTEEYESIIERLGIPVVLALTESVNAMLPAFKVDDILASFDAVNYLVARGHQQVAMITGPRYDAIAGEARYQGYARALSHHALTVNPTLVVETSDFRFVDGYIAMKELLSLQNPPAFTAVFAAADELALGAMRALHETGFQVPIDMSVMGFDNLGIASMITPKLTTVSQPFYQIGADAVRALAKRLAGDEMISGGIHYLQHRVVGRESVRSIGLGETAVLG